MQLSLDVVSLLLSQGMMHPSEVTDHLITVSTFTNKEIAEQALSMLNGEMERHSSINFWKNSTHFKLSFGKIAVLKPTFSDSFMVYAGFHELLCESKAKRNMFLGSLVSCIENSSLDSVSVF